MFVIPYPLACHRFVEFAKQANQNNNHKLQIICSQKNLRIYWPTLTISFCSSFVVTLSFFAYREFKLIIDTWCRILCSFIKTSKSIIPSLIVIFCFYSIFFILSHLKITIAIICRFYAVFLIIFIRGLTDKKCT